MKVAGPTTDPDAAIVELRRATVLREGPHVVVDGHIVDRAKRVLELNASNLVRLAEGLVEQKRQDVQLEKRGVEAEGREHGTPNAPAAGRVAQLL